MRARFRKRLADWYEVSARDLPWRRKPTLYRVWVSEVMLQQTRVEVVVDYFKRFTKQFPSVRKLAKADLEEVLQVWSGLGYYRRARMLHAAACKVVTDYKGRIPHELADIMRLPGIGRYTAGAILSIADDQPTPIVDGNIERVFARIVRLDKPVKSGEAKKTLWQLALEHVSAGHCEGLQPSVLNQSLMELGATVCTPLSPSCSQCPVSRYCEARQHKQVGDFPVVAKRVKPQTRRYLFVALHDADGRILMQRRHESDNESLLPAGLWELPHIEWKTSKRAAFSQLCQQLDCDLLAIGKPQSTSHAIMNFKLTLSVQPCETDSSVKIDKHRRWFKPATAREAAISSATRKLLQSLI